MLEPTPTSIPTVQNQMPARLQPWSNELAGASTELLAALMPWLDKIDRQLQSGSRNLEAETGNVDGYAGLGRMGSLDRLMISDWLLAQDHPDEFLRRFTDRELSYYQFAYEKPNESSELIVLFDAGPDQIGNPRLAHIALFVVFARRAAVLNSKFRWGVLQDDNNTLHDDIGPDAVKRLLSARSWQSASNDHLEQWTLALDSVVDLWCVSTLEQSIKQPTQQIHIEPIAGSQPSTLDMFIRSRNGEKHLLLECPQSPVCVRLLRDPYKDYARQPDLSNFDSFIFSSDSRRLFVFGPTTTHIYSLHFSGKIKPTKPTIVERANDEAVIGVQQSKKQTFQLNATPTRLRLRSRSGYQTYNLPIDWSSPETATRVKNCWVMRSYGDAAIYFIDSANVLWSLPYKVQGSQPTEIERNVVAGLMIDGAFRYWVADDEALIEYRVHQSKDTIEWHRCRWDGLDVGFVRSNTMPIHVAASIRKTSVVVIFDGNGVYFQDSKQPKMTYCEFPPDFEFHGICLLENHLWAVGYQAEHNTITGFNVQNHISNARITIKNDVSLEKLCTAPSSSLIACKTSDGTGFVADFNTSQIVLRFGPSA